jgi:hypothetical protein
MAQSVSLAQPYSASSSGWRSRAGREKIEQVAHARFAFGGLQVGVSDVEPGVDDADDHALAGEAGFVAENGSADPLLGFVEQDVTGRSPVQFHVGVIVDEQRDLVTSQPKRSIAAADQ